MNGSPCKDCPKRVLGCHDRCEEYQKYHKENVDRNEKRVSFDRLMWSNAIQDRKTKTYYRELMKK